MKTDLEKFKSLAKKLGYSILKEEKSPKFKKHTETSNNGHKWTEVAPNTWKDETSGLIWHDKIEGKFNWQEALDKAKELGLELPKASDFMIMVEHGGMKFLPGLKNNCFWSSSPSPLGSGSAYVFLGSDGLIFYDRRDDAYSVRCVGR